MLALLKLGRLAGVIAVTIYVIIEIEYPRMGLVRGEDFHHALVNRRASMK